MRLHCVALPQQRPWHRAIRVSHPPSASVSVSHRRGTPARVPPAGHGQDRHLLRRPSSSGGAAHGPPMSDRAANHGRWRGPGRWRNKRRSSSTASQGCPEGPSAEPTRNAAQRSGAPLTRPAEIQPRQRSGRPDSHLSNMRPKPTPGSPAHPYSQSSSIKPAARITAADASVFPVRRWTSRQVSASLMTCSSP
jgi:hypothetical protein